MELLYSTHTHPPLLPYVFIFLEEGGPQVSNISITWELFLETEMLRLSSDPLNQKLCGWGAVVCVLTSPLV